MLEVDEVRTALSEADLHHLPVYLLPTIRAGSKDVELSHLLEHRKDSGEQLVVQQVVLEHVAQTRLVRFQRPSLWREVEPVEEEVFTEELVIGLEEEPRGLLQEHGLVGNLRVLVREEDVASRGRTEPDVGSQDVLYQPRWVSLCQVDCVEGQVLHTLELRDGLFQPRLERLVGVRLVVGWAPLRRCLHTVLQGLDGHAVDGHQQLGGLALPHGVQRLLERRTQIRELYLHSLHRRPRRLLKRSVCYQRVVLLRLDAALHAAERSHCQHRLRRKEGQVGVCGQAHASCT